MGHSFLGRRSEAPHSGISRSDERVDVGPLEKADEVSWLTRLWKLLRSALGDEPEDLAVDDSRGGPATSSITLVPGSLRLRVGVVSTVGNHREHNEDNFYVPG